MNISAKIGMGLIMLMVAPFLVQAQMMDPIHFDARASVQELAAGDSATITVEAAIEGDWHLYSVNNDPDAGPYPTKFSTAQIGVILSGAVEESAPRIELDPNFNAELGWHTGEATFEVPVTVTNTAPSADSLRLEVFYQVCDDKVCLPPKSKEVAAGVRIVNPSGVAELPANEPQSSSDTANRNVAQQQKNVRPQSASQSGTPFSFILLALAAGFGALLTPCVFPMVPLTVSYFSKDSTASGSGYRALGFGAAIVLIFTGLGVLLALFIGASGANRFAANPWVNLFIAFVLILFAVSLLGAFELRLPHQFTNRLHRLSDNSSGVWGILFMAFSISAVSFSCTAPFVGGVLAATAGGEWFYPIIGMMCFSAAFASPFVLLAVFPGWLQKLPASGAWMNTVKVLLGFIELAAALKFLSNADLVWQWGLVSRPFVIAAWIVIFMLAGFYVLGFFTMKHEPPVGSIRTGRLFLAMPFLLFSFYLIPGLLGSSLGIWDAWLPPKQATDVRVVNSFTQRGGAEHAMQQWREDYAQARDVAREQHHPVFIDFTGYTCTNCRAMEANVFPLASVQEHFESMTLVRLYTDDGTDGVANQQFQFKRTGTVALPTYIIVDPETEAILAKLVGYSDAQEFVKFLETGRNRYKNTLKAVRP